MEVTEVMQKHLKLAKSLHPRLLHLFKRWPPREIAALAPARSQSQTITTSETEAPSDSNASEPKPASFMYATKTNPFMPWKNPRTGNWHGAHYSLRRQAELYKLAKQHNCMSLMPISPKHPEVKEKKRIELGVRVRGTGVGQKVRGKKWERQLGEKLAARRTAMAEMPETIKQWKLLGHGRGWKKWPK